MEPRIRFYAVYGVDAAPGIASGFKLYAVLRDGRTFKYRGAAQFMMYHRYGTVESKRFEAVTVAREWAARGALNSKAWWGFKAIYRYEDNVAVELMTAEESVVGDPGAELICAVN